MDRKKKYTKMFGSFAEPWSFTCSDKHTAVKATFVHNKPPCCFLCQSKYFTIGGQIDNAYRNNCQTNAFDVMSLTRALFL